MASILPPNALNMKFLRIFLVIALLAGLPESVLGATLTLSPSATSVHAGDIVTVRLVANTQGTAINQGEGRLRFPTDMLDVVSVSKAGSIFSLWVEEPTFSNIAGTMQFDGGVPTPGYTGSAGTILSVTFHAKKNGTATLTLSDSALRANDGLGTDVLTSSGSGQITIIDATPTPVTPAPPQESTPTKPPEVTARDSGNVILNLASPSHSNQNGWYQNNSPLLTWQVPAGANAVQTIVDADFEAVPTVIYKPAIVEKRLTELEDGVWYFNVRARMGTAWGPTATYTLRIDGTEPKLSTPSFEYDSAHQALILSGVSATDETSGIDRFELTIDGTDTVDIPVSDLAGGTYAYPFAKAGIHSAVLRVFDNAGNHTEISDTFNTPTPLANQTLWNLGGFNITFAWFIVFILLISILSLIAAGTAWYKLYILRQGARSRIEKRDKLLHRSLRIYKEDLERHLRALERAGSKRELTDEEAEINEDLKKNVDDLERYLAKEFKKFD